MAPTSPSCNERSVSHLSRGHLACVVKQITWCAALVTTPAFACSQVHIVHRVQVGLIRPFPAIIARAHAPPSLSTTYVPPPCSTGWVTERLHFFTFASARCLLSHRQDQFPSTGELGESTDPTAHEYITVIVLPLLSTQLSPCSYSSSIVFSAFWNFSVFGFPFRPVLYHDTLTAARSKFIKCLDTDLRRH